MGLFQQSGRVLLFNFLLVHAVLERFFLLFLESLPSGARSICIIHGWDRHGNGSKLSCTYSGLLRLWVLDGEMQVLFRPIW
jgi:hypothetical protein